MARRKMDCNQIGPRKFSRDDRQRHDVAEPGCFTSVQKVDKCPVECPARDRQKANYEDFADLAVRVENQENSGISAPAATDAMTTNKML